MWKDAEEFFLGKDKQSLSLRDKYIGSLIQKWGSCTIKPQPESQYFEDLADAICSQQVSEKAAKTIFRRVKDLLVKVTPEKVMSKTDQELRGCGLSWQKVSYLKDLAIKTLNGELQVKNLDRLSDEEIIVELIKVKGIGRWTAEMFLMFSLARPDILPKDDLGINKALKNLGISEKDTEKWKPYRTVASWYLWRSLENR